MKGMTSNTMDKRKLLRKRVYDAIETYGGNMSKVAKELNIPEASVRQLYREEGNA